VSRFQSTLCQMLFLRRHYCPDSETVPWLSTFFDRFLTSITSITDNNIVTNWTIKNNPSPCGTIILPLAKRLWMHSCSIHFNAELFKSGTFQLFELYPFTRCTVQKKNTPHPVKIGRGVINCCLIGKNLCRYINWAYPRNPNETLIRPRPFAFGQAERCRQKYYVNWDENGIMPKLSTSKHKCYRVIPPTCNNVRVFNHRVVFVTFSTK
jgi:hypothetical protein